MAQTFEKIKATTDKQLIELVDAACNAHARGGGLDLKPILEAQLLLNEVAKRDQDRATQAMLQLT